MAFLLYLPCLVRAVPGDRPARRHELARPNGKFRCVSTSEFRDATLSEDNRVWHLHLTSDRTPTAPRWWYHQLTNGLGLGPAYEAGGEPVEATSDPALELPLLPVSFLQDYARGFVSRGTEVDVPGGEPGRSQADYPTARWRASLSREGRVSVAVSQGLYV